MELVDKCAPVKYKYLTAKYSKVMTKELRKAIMLRTKLQNQYLKKKRSYAKARYKKQKIL